MTLLRCPFCGEEPETFPKAPHNEGNAWGEVRCVNDECSAQPIVKDGEDVADSRGAEKYIELAVKRWNQRH